MTSDTWRPETDPTSQSHVQLSSLSPYTCHVTSSTIGGDVYNLAKAQTAYSSSASPCLPETFIRKEGYYLD